MFPQVNPALVKGFSNPNLLINSDGEVDQRQGGSYTANGYAFDRWFYTNNQDTGAFSRMAGELAPGWNGVRPFGFAAASEIRSARGMSQRIENALQFSGKTVTLSCLAKGAVGQVIQVVLVAVDSASQTMWVSDYITLGTCTGEIDFFETTVDIPAFDDAGYDFTSNNNHKLTVTFRVNTTHTDSIYIGSPKLEFGSVATPYVKEDYTENFLKCSRFYARLRFKEIVIPDPGHYSGIIAETYFMVRMRTIPSAQLLASSGNYAPNIFGIDESSCTISSTVSATTYGNITCFYELDSEL